MKFSGGMSHRVWWLSNLHLWKNTLYETLKSVQCPQKCFLQTTDKPSIPFVRRESDRVSPLPACTPPASFLSPGLNMLSPHPGENTAVVDMPSHGEMQCSGSHFGIFQRTRRFVLLDTLARRPHAGAS